MILSGKLGCRVSAYVTENRLDISPMENGVGKMEIVKWLFEKFRNKEMSDDEVLEYMRENHLLMETSVADLLLDNLKAVRDSSISFQSLADTCQRGYINYLSLLGASEEESFSDYVNLCIQRGVTAGKKLNNLSRNEQDEFWSLVYKISEHLKE